jgi:multicomponent Na+:H+ antiporter subunit D
VAAIFAGLLTKVGVYSLIRVFTLIFVTDVDYNQTVILIISGLTIVTGILGALVQNEFRRILSFNLVSHIGFITMGLALGTPLALAGAIFYIIHDVIVKTNLFLISGLVQRLTGSDKFSKTGGLYRRYPMLAWLFLIPALSLAGIPPLSGFWPKLMLLTAALDLKDYIIVAAALLTSLLTLMSMTKIWQEVFWKDRPDGNVETDLAQALSPNWLYSLLPVIGLSFMTVLIGLAAEPIFALASRAANQLLDVDLYITTVLGG